MIAKCGLHCKHNTVMYRIHTHAQFNLKNTGAQKKKKKLNSILIRMQLKNLNKKIKLKRNEKQKLKK